MTFFNFNMEQQPDYQTYEIYAYNEYKMRLKPGKEPMSMEDFIAVYRGEKNILEVNKPNVES